VEIVDARVGRLLVSRSQVRVVNSHVRDGVESHDSRVEITGGSLGGDPPLLLDETNIDAAGLRILPRGRMVAENYGDATITLRLSVAEIVIGDHPDGELRWEHVSEFHADLVTLIRLKRAAGRRSFPGSAGTKRCGTRSPKTSS
jgi:hypothetical protein